MILSHDRPEELTRAYRSVLAQTVKPERIVIVFSGKEIAVSYGGIPTVAVRCEGTGGAARNAGASLCDDGFIAFLDDDDEWSPGKLESQLPMFSEGVCMVCSPYFVESETGADVFRPRIQGSILEENVLGCTSMVLLRKDAFDAAGGFDPRMQSNQEWDLWIRMLDLGETECSDDIVGTKHDSADSISSDGRRRERGWIRLLSKHLPRYLHDPRALERALWFFYRDMLFLRRWIPALIGAALYGAVRVPMILLDIARGIDPNRGSGGRRCRRRSSSASPERRMSSEQGASNRNGRERWPTACDREEV